jgi:hypothetical protein
MASNNNNNNDDDQQPSQNLLIDQMETVMQLMTKRAHGEVSNTQIESAVSGILTSMGVPSHPPQSSTSIRTATEEEVSKETTIQVDTGNYDDDDGDGDDSDEEDKKNDNHNLVQAAATKDNNTNVMEENNNVVEAEDDEFYQEEISQIPLGKEGGKMMTTFGDGPKPHPSAIVAALLGTRKVLQTSIMDARAVRRRDKQTFEDARQSFVQRNKKTSSEAVNPTILYRAISGYDRLSLQPKCGFDVEQLMWLFPEEMSSYERWNDMHTEYTKNTEEEEKLSNSKSKSSAGQGEIQEPAASTAAAAAAAADEPIGGHLKARAAHFDIRTEKMKSQWYIKFSKVRQGSFLARGKRHRKTKAEVQWEENRKLSKRGRRTTGVWETMSANSVRFLHWLGFEPPAIYPPNEETTQALAFLGYDIMGKIVEKVRTKTASKEPP